MRVIKFRGSCIGEDRWAYGDLITTFGNTTYTAINDLKLMDTFEVDSDSVGQFTGLKDKNGKEIYEGDILKIKLKEDEVLALVVYEEGNHRFAIDMPRKQIEKMWNKSSTFRTYCNTIFGNFSYFTDIEVVGNSYDDFWLLELI